MEHTTQSPETKLNIMADESATLSSGTGFMEPGTTRKRGRPKGSTKKVGSTPGSSFDSGVSPGGTSASSHQVPHVDPIAELMPLTTGLASFYSNMLIQIAEDQRAALTKEKSDIIAHTSAVCLNQYFPGALGAHASAIVLGVTVLETSLTAVRLRKENLEKMREEFRRKQQEKSQNIENGH